MQVGLDYPSYTGRKDESLTNVGDLIVPVGTQIVAFNAQHATQMDVQFGRGLFTPAKIYPQAIPTRNTRKCRIHATRFLSNQYVQYADSSKL